MVSLLQAWNAPKRVVSSPILWYSCFYSWSSVISVFDLRHGGSRHAKDLISCPFSHHDRGILIPHMLCFLLFVSSSVSQGTIASWEKKVGDKVKPGDILCQVETDKATVAFESVEEGYLAGIIAASGSAVPVGQVTRFPRNC
jgi:hypothetical protein